MMDSKSLKGKIALVTGGSKGVGKGIAIGLGEAGATVYITGRSSYIENVAEQISAVGGKGIAMKCDHRIDKESEKVFDKLISSEGRIDILINNAWGGYESMFDDSGKYIWENNFWEQPLNYWDQMFNGGVRISYVNSYFAARIMTKQNHGLIINISFWSAKKYLNNVAYGIAKAATDKLTEDTAYELKKYNISVISLYPGLVKTERVLDVADYLDLSNSETPQYIGRVISELTQDPDLMTMTGSVQIAAQLGSKYNVKDINGEQPKPLTMEDV